MTMLTQEGKNLIKSFETLCLYPYKNKGDVWTIGWGHTHNVTGDMGNITVDEAEDFFDDDCQLFESLVNKLIHVPLTDNEFSALTSLCFNTGAAPLLQTLGAKLNNGDYIGAAGQFDLWVHQHGIVLNGLVRRRSAEKALFLKDLQN